MTQKNTFSKPKYKSPSIEDIVPLKIYSFTINPEKQYYNKGAMRHISIIQDVTDVLNKYNNYKYNLYMEISKNGRIHFHGTIHFEDPWDFYYTIIYKLQQMSTYYIDTIEDQKVWNEYILKQQKYVPKYMKYNITNIEQLLEKK